MGNLLQTYRVQITSSAVARTALYTEENAEKNCLYSQPARLPLFPKLSAQIQLRLTTKLTIKITITAEQNKILVVRDD